jgi:Flp pilus assembly protein TadG
MKSPTHQRAQRGNKDGQALILFTLFLLVLILFVGLGIDLGFAYITKAQLSKAIDAATLAGVSNYQQSDSGAAARTNALNTFYANYATNGVTGRAAAGAKVTPTVTFGLDANNNRTITVQASATINTYFLRALSVLGDTQWKTLTVGDSASATRSKVVMTLVLDTSLSMDPTCDADYGNCPWCSEGGLYLPNAVTQFINIFDDKVDRAAVVSFGTVPEINVAMNTLGSPFKANVISFVNTLKNSSGYAGYTFSPGGLTNALVINNAVNDSTAIKVVVFFTDGQPNAVESVLTNNTASIPTPCLTGSHTNWIYAGFDSGNPCFQSPEVLFFFPPNVDSTELNSVCTQPGSCCGGTGVLNEFRSWDGTLKTFTEANVVAESTNRCILISNQMRANSNYVYAVGLNNGAIGAPALDLLQEVANDPNSPTYNASLPVGAALISNGNDLTQVFQQIASDIILRLIQ